MIITNDIKYVGVNDHGVDLFEGQYVVPKGISYNSYVIVDGKNSRYGHSRRSLYSRVA